MSRRKSTIYGLITYVLTLGLVLGVIFISNANYTYGDSPMKVFCFYLLGAIFFGLVNTFVHEAGHILFGKKNGFEILSFTAWFFKWTKIKNKFRFSLTMIGNESGYTESVPKSKENLDKRLKAMTSGGLIFSLGLMILSIIPFFFIGEISIFLFAFLSMCLPISLYFFLWNILPIINEGIYNDGAVIYSIRKKTDTAKVMLALLAIHSELYNGKTPAEIDEKLYFDLPQLPEDDLFFANLLNARYNYYLDKGETENCLKVSERLLGLVDYMPKQYEQVVKSDALYNACVFEKDGNKADALMYEVEKYLNGVNSLTNIRIKTAYLLLINENREQIDMFYVKGKKEAKKCQIKGLGKFEEKLLDGLVK